MYVDLVRRGSNAGDRPNGVKMLETKVSAPVAAAIASALVVWVGQHHFLISRVDVRQRVCGATYKKGPKTLYVNLTQN